MVEFTDGSLLIRLVPGLSFLSFFSFVHGMRFLTQDVLGPGHLFERRGSRTLRSESPGHVPVSHQQSEGTLLCQKPV